MSSLQSYMDQFRRTAGLTLSEEAATKGQMLSLQAALKQHFFKATNRTLAFPIDKHEHDRVYKKYQDSSADMGLRGMSRSAWSDEYSDDLPDVEAYIDDIKVENVDGYPLITFMFTVEGKDGLDLTFADVSDKAVKKDLLDVVAKIAKGIYPKTSHVSVNNATEDTIEVVL
jgi:hypothetical protein